MRDQFKSTEQSRIFPSDKEPMEILLLPGGVGHSDIIDLLGDHLPRLYPVESHDTTMTSTPEVPSDVSTVSSDVTLSVDVSES